MSTNSQRLSPIAAVLIALVLANTAVAVDGVLEINQACALNGGCFPGDTTGFPVTIDAAGSYLLTGNLSLATNSTTGIDVTSSNVTIDLNGFEIACDSCASAANGIGVRAGPDFSNIAVRNGTIRNVGNDGIALTGVRNSVDAVRVIDPFSIGISLGDDCRITNNTVAGSTFVGINSTVRCHIAHNLVQDSGNVGIDTLGDTMILNNVSNNNANDGIECTSNCTITGNIVRNNGGAGIDVANGVVAYNVASSNTGDGIEAPQSVVVDNVATGNTGFGLSGDVNTAFGRNLFSFNNSNGDQVSGAVLETDSNICHGDLICP